MRARPLDVAAILTLSGCASLGPTPELPALEETVMATERAFAQTMVDRDHAAFATFLSDEAIFFSGETPIRGKAAVAADWAPFFEGSDPPFTWEPTQVQVLDSGTLALSTGPVYDPQGTVIANFNSVWRKEAPGVWRIVFDRGSPVCSCGGSPGSQ
jgi:ketosteroid isomerase-like protein